MEKGEKRVLITFSGRTNSRECLGLNHSGQLIPSGFISGAGVEGKAEECRLCQISLRKKLRRSTASAGWKGNGVNNASINTGEKQNTVGKKRPPCEPRENMCKVGLHSRSRPTWECSESLSFLSLFSMVCWECLLQAAVRNGLRLWN